MALFVFARDSIANLGRFNKYFVVGKNYKLVKNKIQQLKILQKLFYACKYFNAKAV